MNTLTETSVRLFASAKSWIKEDAVRQLYAASELEGVRLAVGFSDLSPGKGSPAGAAFVSEGFLYPHLIGGDVGCGMTLFKTDLVQRDVNLDRWAELPFDLEFRWEGDPRKVLAGARLKSSQFDANLGTIGAGNHFAELQRLEQVFDAGGFQQLGLGKQQLVMLVHSGSRGLGESILCTHLAESEAPGLIAESVAAATFLRDHDAAVRWAKANRGLIGWRFARALGAHVECLWDGCHNSLTRCESDGEVLWVHRKGAVAIEGGPLMIPGSCGSLSYLVKPIADGASHAWSLAHGAGRKWARSEACLRMRERFGSRLLTQTSLGGRVVCGQRDLLYADAPEAYKDIADVVQDLAEAGLVSVIATFRPLLTYKTRARRR